MWNLFRRRQTRLVGFPMIAHEPFLSDGTRRDRIYTRCSYIAKLSASDILEPATGRRLTTVPVSVRCFQFDEG